MSNLYHYVDLNGFSANFPDGLKFEWNCDHDYDPRKKSILQKVSCLLGILARKTTVNICKMSKWTNLEIRISGFAIEAVGVAVGVK